jgi:cytochrome P450
MCDVDHTSFGRPQVASVTEEVTARNLPPGPRYPAWLQLVGWWSRPVAFRERCRARYGRRYTVRLPATPPLVHLGDPEEVREVFTAPPEVLHPGEGARVLEPVVGRNSVILLDEGAHLEQRKLMLPAFHGERMERLEGLVSEVAGREVATWPRGEPVELHGRLQALTLEVILHAVFGLDPGRRLDDIRALLTGVLAAGDRWWTMLGQPPRRWVERVGPWAPFFRQRDRARELVEELVEERRAEGERATQRDDVLAMLLAARHEDGSPMSIEELRDELMTLLVAGHETTASELAWAFERLAREPAVRDDLAAEIRSGGDDAYLMATIHETLRRRPVLPNAAPRLAMTDVEVGGWTYPPGVALVPDGYAIHHDPAIYPDPYVFRPERFLDRKPGTYTWIPFGGGRRRCLGASFAMLEMKAVLRAVFEAADLAPAANGVELARRRQITISPAAGAVTELRDRALGPT